MPLRSFPFKWTCLVGTLLLGSVFWSAAGLDAGFGFLRFLICGLCFLVSAVISLILALVHRSRMSLYRILINVAVCLLFFSAIRVGGIVRDQLFLRHLARFQEVTNFLIANERATANPGEFAVVVQLPASYSDLRVADKVYIKSSNGDTTVEYLERETSALGHTGYMYRSNDSTTALE